LIVQLNLIKNACEKIREMSSLRHRYRLYGINSSIFGFWISKKIWYCENTTSQQYT